MKSIRYAVVSVVQPQSLTRQFASMNIRHLERFGPLFPIASSSWRGGQSLAGARAASRSSSQVRRSGIGVRTTAWKRWATRARLSLLELFSRFPVSDGPDSVVLRFMRSLDSKFDRMADDTREIKGRVGALVERYASISRRLDSLEFRVERIEHRLELIGEHTS